jgi:hypothetical protein
MAEHDILALPGAVARCQRLQRRAIGDDGGFETVRAAQGDALDRHAVRHRAERRAIDASGRGRRHARSPESNVAAIAGTFCVRAILPNPAMAMQRSLTLSPYLTLRAGVRF